MARNIIDFKTIPLSELYGSNVFNDAIMRERLPKSIYKELKRVQEGMDELTLEVAEVVASSMRDWAIERGATHYTHWFQPLTGLTAGKHESFIAPTPDGKVIMEFSGKELIKGEPDASSFPSGGLRATFEARGYTAWDVTSPAFLKEDNTGTTLYIPTAFVSYTGEALDKKVPLLRSMQALSKQAMRILKTLGNASSSRVITTVGPEQEYFLVDKEYFDKRLDLILTGRTLFGAPAPKGQELEDHYFGELKERVAAFMRELNAELWKLGIAAKTQHNEVAPNQFEIAPVFSSSNTATDANQLVMESLKMVASRHNLVALLHEKPFAGVNGSGKHNNWSMATDDGINLLDPGDSPQGNAQFLLFVMAVIKAVDLYAPILRMAASNPGNDHRLGANEAPPAIVSIFLGDQLSELLEKVAANKPVPAREGGTLIIGINSMPKLPRDLTDRNRTSPFAFTGNKFEFRMVPSSESIAGPNIALNTAVAQVLSEFAEILEKSKNMVDSIHKIVVDTYAAHKRVIFNGNNYAPEWIKEAEKRGLPNIAATVEAIPEITKPYAVELFSRHKVLTKEELESRCAIYLERYAKTINIEARTMTAMVNRAIFPAVSAFIGQLSASIAGVKAISAGLDASAQEALLKDLLGLLKELRSKNMELEKTVDEAHHVNESVYKHACAYKYSVMPKMTELRSVADKLELLLPKTGWPFPTYEDLLFKL